MEKQGMLELKMLVDGKLDEITISQNGNHVESIKSIELLINPLEVNHIEKYGSSFSIYSGKRSWTFIFITAEQASAEYNHVKRSIKWAISGDWMMHQYPHPEAEAAKEHIANVAKENPQDAQETQKIVDEPCELSEEWKELDLSNMHTVGGQNTDIIFAGKRLNRRQALNLALWITAMLGVDLQDFSILYNKLGY